MSFSTHESNKRQNSIAPDCSKALMKTKPNLFAVAEKQQ
jgi:hypothetical protein